ncbi:hypothetical protein D7V80_00915 [Corallococcus sp. CA054B]|uniref:hypothetical protein n=1 Tax=Corallococcus sp. CA054B TaxID=2316734 RepID=UPI000EA053D4|nr:hypothetical protein [Corallococcus sp. CA054B]RKG71653.1 hypothetical protein D7V80_00915 [Corallococcus sp. CA054B]
MSREGARPPQGNLAPRRIPEAYVRAEVASFPLTSLGSFRSALTELVPSLDSAAGAPTQALWRDCEKSLSEHASGWSLDRIIAVRDAFWFPSRGHASLRRAPREGVSMLHYLRHLAGTHLERRPGVTVIFQGTGAEAVEALTHYRWLTFAMPEDLLLAALPVEPPPTRVDIEPPLLVRSLLDRGVAEVHHHVGAGMDFTLLWASLLSAVGDPELDPRSLMGPGLPFDDAEVMLRWLLAAAVTRCVLGEVLLREETPPLLEFVHGLAQSQAWLPQRRRVLSRTLEALSRGRREVLPELDELRGLYEDLHPMAARNVSEPPETLDEVWRRCDPVALRLRLSTANAGERWLVRAGLTHLGNLEHAGLHDVHFDRLFWQVQRVRCLSYRAYVQRPMTAGLQWFIRFYGRPGALKRPLRAVRTEVSYAVAGGGQPIAALEVRTSLSDDPINIAEELASLARSWRGVLVRTGEQAMGGRPPEFGVVLHLLKARDPSRHWTKGQPPAHGMGTYAEPVPEGRVQLGGRFSDYFALQSVQVEALVDLLRAVPLSLWLVRGLDVASDELSVPTWVLAPLYRYVRWGAARAATKREARAAPPLRLTSHVGEDYRHLMEGLRRIYESLHYLLDRTGGRLGHATALGVEPGRWAESVGVVMMPVEDRLWDLVFEWRLYSDYRLPPALAAEAPPGRPQRVENMLRELSEAVFGFGDCVAPHVLAEAHHVLHNLWCPPLSREEGGVGLDAFSRTFYRLDWSRVLNAKEVQRVLRAYREEEGVFRRGQQLVDIPLDASEVDALRSVQDGMRRYVSARGTVVEVNPSSNLLIGNLLDLRNHPILRLNPPLAEDGAPPPVPIAVGADDPVTFSTFLLREYSLLHEAARSAGYSERVVHEWLSNIRRTSMDARFTAPWRPSALHMVDELLDALARFARRAVPRHEAPAPA